MKQFQSKFMPLVMAGLGVVGFLLRKGLYGVALDAKNLLVDGHPLQWLLFLVTAAAIVLAVMCDGSREGLGHGNIPTAAGYLVLAAGVLMSVLPQGFDGTGLTRMRNILGILTSLAMVLGAVQRFRGRQVFFLVPGLGCVFFAVHMVSCYQGWSSNPQIQDYLYTLLSSVALMLFAYQQSALAADCGSRKLRNIFGSLSVFFGITALSGTEYPLIYLSGSIWALACLLWPEGME